MIITPSSVPNQLVSQDGTLLQVIVVDIGPWVMKSNPSITVPIPVMLGRVRFASLIIYSDAGTLFYINPFGMGSFDQVSTFGCMMYGVTADNNIVVTYSQLGAFNTISFDDPTMNRCIITLIYET